MTGSQILAAFEAIGAVVRLTPAGVVDVDSPDVPELERLIAEAKANRPEVVAELKRHAVAIPGLPGRAERPCLACGRQCPEGVLFDTGACFETWKAARAVRRARATSPQDGKTATSPAHGIPPSSPPRGAG